MNTSYRRLPNGVRHVVASCFIVAVTIGLPVRAEVIGPYQPDSHTLHLYHFDQDGVSQDDSKNNDSQFSLKLSANAQIARGHSYPGWGSSLDTRADQAAGAYGRESLPAEVFWNASTGAFTVEAVVRMDFNPNEILKDRRERMQIVGLGGTIGNPGDRPFQFGLRPIGVMGATVPTLEFINISSGKRMQTLLAPLPSSGLHAPHRDRWYHVAVAYDGKEGTAGNFKFYWTLLDNAVTEANLLASATMNSDLGGRTGNLAIGNISRGSKRIREYNWLGQIDEVRLSDVARASDEFIFAPKPIVRTTKLQDPLRTSNSRATNFDGK